MIIKRDIYLNQVIAARGNGLIKIISGIRRCGKSFLLFKLFQNYLLESGVPGDHIIKVALDDIENIDLRKPLNLLAHIKKQITDSEPYFVLLDEVQMVEDFTGVLNSLLHIDNVDVYVTGSNSKFLSKDIVTEFRGRGYDIHMHPLSFAEYYSAVGGDKSDALRDYYMYGGLPQILSVSGFQARNEYLKHLVETVFLSDVAERNNVKNVTELNELFKIMASGIGSPCNPQKLSNTFKSVKNTTIDRKTVTNYLSYFCDAFLLEKADRYNIKGKKYIGSLSKYYFSDMGLRNALLGFRQIEETHIMENVIFNELLIRGFAVDVGCVESREKDSAGKELRKQYEVDFVANRGYSRYYIQSAFFIPNEEKMQQETAFFDRIDDSFKKVIIVGQNIIPYRNDSGYLIMGIYDFLLKPELLIQD